jgi:XTP/dITP diphosphohydrolase
MMREKIRELLIATGNPGKVREFADMLGGRDVKLLGLKDVAPSPDIEETGRTFIENAILKASGQALAHGLWALADDSGLEVYGLGGRPGIMSARYGGKGLTDPQRVEILLAETKNIPDTERGARFVCAIAVAAPSGDIVLVSEGECIGSIARSPLGIGGFGYDPVFIPDGLTQTFAQLDAGEKKRLSHRGRASREILSNLERMGLL